MRTTVDLPEDVLEEAKHRAAQRRTTLSAVVEEALREASARRSAAQATGPVTLTTDRRRSGLRPGVDLDSNATLLDVMDGADDPL